MVEKHNKEEEDTEGLYIYPSTYNPKLCPRSDSSGVSSGKIINAS